MSRRGSGGTLVGRHHIVNIADVDLCCLVFAVFWVENQNVAVGIFELAIFDAKCLVSWP